MQKKIHAIILIVCTLTGVAAAKQITILNPKDATITEKFAAEELQKYLCKITGEKFEVKSSDGSEEFAITVENNTNPEIKEPVSGREEYVIKSVKDGVVLSGSGDRGTLYAVYDFLEKLGCRWYYMDPEDEIVPELSTEEVIKKSGGLNCVEKPDFGIRMRRFETYDMGPAGNTVAKIIMSKEQMLNRVDWMVKNRINIFQYGIDHNKDCYSHWPGYKAVFDDMKKRALVIGAGGHMFFMFMPKDTFKEHPEWFALINGKRTEDSQFCTSNKDAVNFYIGNMLKFLEENPEIEYFAPWPSDMDKWCECEKCKDKSVSDRYLELSNMVYNTLKEKAPGVTYTHFPYHFYKAPPEKAEPARGMNITLNTWGRNMSYTFYDERTPDEFRKVFSDWKRVCEQYDNTYILHEKYFRHFGLHYHPLAYPILKDEISWFKQQRLDGFELPMGYMGRRTKSLNFYVTCKLMWDSNSDVEAITQDFFQKCYGEQWPVMKKAYEAVLEGQPDYQYFGRQDDLGWKYKTFQTWYPESLGLYAENANRKLQIAVDYAKEALKNAQDEKIKTRIGKFITSTDYAREEWLACSYLCQTTGHDKNLKKAENAAEYIAELNLMEKNLLKAKELSDKRDAVAKENPACGLYWDALWASRHCIYWNSHIYNWLKEVETKRKTGFDSYLK